MSLFCETCNYTGTSKQAFGRHLLSRKHKERLKCKGKKCVCGNTYMSKQTLYVHQKSCQVYINNPQIVIVDDTTTTDSNADDNNVDIKEMVNTLIDEKLNETLQTLKQKDDEIAKLRREKDEQNKLKDEEIREVNEIIREKEEQIKVLLAEKNTTNNIETQNNVIVINNFGEESIDHISIQEILQMINDKPARSPVLLAQKIHFDSEHPENSNVSITGEKSNYAYIQKDGKKKRDYRKKIINEMTQNSFDIIERTYDDNVNVFSHSKQTGVENLKNRFYNNDIKYLTDEMDLMVLNESTEVKPKA